MTWNMAFDMMMEIKHRYTERFGTGNLYDGCTWLRSWADALGIDLYTKVLDEVYITQYGDLALIHYRYQHEIDGQDFFHAYGGVLSECRSLVIDLRNECMVLTPFRKFRNLGECEEVSLKTIMERIANADTVELSEKLDGSMQSARMVDGRLVMSGSRSLDRAESYRLDGGYRYVESRPEYMSMLSDNPGLTFFFESIFENDPHVVSYDREGLFLVGIRDTGDGREYDYSEVISMAGRYGVPTTRLYSMTVQEALEFLKDASGTEHEGFVLNVDGLRVKMKADDYVDLNNWVFGMQDDNMLLKAVLEERIDDVIPRLLPSFREDVVARVGMVTDAIDRRRRRVDEYIDMIAAEGLTERKDVMLWITKNVRRPFDAMVRCRYLKMDVDYTKGMDVEEVFGRKK